jgi:hypothetical protein
MFAIALMRSVLNINIHRMPVVVVFIANTLIPFLLSVAGVYFLAKPNFSKINLIGSKCYSVTFVGILIIYFLPWILFIIFRIVDIHFLWDFYIILDKYFILKIIGLLLIVFGVIKISSNPTEEPSSVENFDTFSSDHNKVVNITLWGGILGLVASSPRKRLAKTIEQENLNGYRIVQIIESSSGNVLLWILRLIILCLTLFIYTPSNGYYVCFEKIEDNTK